VLSITPRHTVSYNRINTIITIFKPIARTILPSKARLPQQINASMGLRVGRM